MHISDFDYDLPPELIAREPVRPRDASRMMVVRASTGALVDTEFRKLPEFLEPSDVLVINDTRVMRARIQGTLMRSSGGTRNIEVLFAAPVSEDTWEVMVKPGKRIHPGDRVLLDSLEGIFGNLREHGLRELRLTSPQDLPAFLERHGHVPLPPYINRPDTLQDVVDYQTIFAREPGAVAAPTAGLHFTPAILDALKSRGIETLTITLHVGVGTFIPVRVDDPRKHILKPEHFELSAPVADRLNAARGAGRRIVSVGTTTTRTLEHVVSRYGRFQASSGEAGLFILPGYEFRAVGAMLTNFHLPRSTLLMLVCAFASRSVIMKAYAHAVEGRYRFYSYGDCMLLVQ
ncbi:MAG: tRNA preQ1(34) S-adenosylmethionine ribosyltransferase-isomerase QueA [Acidobacteria bacterium]|nr:tRNA preQ1(34) S-adenosylmethionine ribosyltransferase-isomerase QueA [Acidobacteriota bacterium]